VFVTSTAFSADFGGAPGADAKCQAGATGQHLGGNWRAWISDDSSSPADRFIHLTVPYVLLNGTVIAKNWTELTSGTLENNGIYLDETGTAQAGVLVWTATKANGNESTPTPCGNWMAPTTSSMSAGTGTSANVSTQWTEGLVEACGSSSLHLYCFQQ
jgi:hypothetical protein